MRQFGLLVKIFATRDEAGRAAAEEVSQLARDLLAAKPQVRMIFAAAPSQNEFLQCFSQDRRIDFARITAFHMDEYVGLAPDAPQGFGNFLRERLFGRAPFGAVHYIDGAAGDMAAECRRYAKLLNEAPIDIVCMGVGENGHIAFNDPGAADRSDPLDVKLVALDGVCRMQQVHDGCFAHIDEVPERAATLTVQRLCRADHHFCVVPAATKRQAVRRAICGPIGDDCPATYLRLCRDARFYLDADSAALL